MGEKERENWRQRKANENQCLRNGSTLVLVREHFGAPLRTVTCENPSGDRPKEGSLGCYHWAWKSHRTTLLLLISLCPLGSFLLTGSIWLTTEKQNGKSPVFKQNFSLLFCYKLVVYECLWLFCNLFHVGKNNGWTEFSFLYEENDQESWT